MLRREIVLIVLLVGLSLAFLGLALFGKQGLREVRRLRSERQELATEIERLRERRRELEAEIGALRTDARAIEDRARRDLGMIRKGETVFLLPEHHAKQR